MRTYWMFISLTLGSAGLTAAAECGVALTPIYDTAGTITGLRLENKTNLVITAYAAGITRETATGSNGSFQSKDSAFSGSAQDQIAPHSQQQVATSKALEGNDVESQFLAIFEDGTSCGDPELESLMLARRQQAARDVQQIRTAFGNLRDRNAGREALVNILMQLRESYANSHPAITQMPGRTPARMNQFLLRPAIAPLIVNYLSKQIIQPGLTPGQILAGVEDLLDRTALHLAASKPAVVI